MANIKTRTLTSPTDPGTSSAKNSALTHGEMDSNLLLLNNEKLENTTDDFVGELSIKGSGSSARGSVRLYDNDDSAYVDLKANATITSQYTFTFPPEPGSNGFVLKTTGTGDTFWAADASGTTADSTTTFTNKTIDLTDNTLTGTTAEFNTALSDNDFATLAGTETLTNKTLTSPVISTITTSAGAITIAPNGGSNTKIQSNVVQLGQTNTDTKITTNGTGDLILDTNDGTNTGEIKIFDGTGGDIRLTTTGGNANVLLKPALPTGDAGPGSWFGWNYDNSGGVAHLNSVLSIKAGTDTPDTNLLYNEGIQITSTSRQTAGANPTYPTVAIKANDATHRNQTLAHGATNSQGYANHWFVRINKDDDDTIAAVDEGQILGGFFYGGNRNTGESLNTSVGMFARAVETWSDSQTGARLEFELTPSGTGGSAGPNRIPVFDLYGDKVVVNEDNNDVDFIVNGDTTSDVFKVDAGTEIVSTGGVFQLYSASSNPTSNLAEGQMYFNSTDKKFYGYNGTSWVVIGTQT